MKKMLCIVIVSAMMLCAAGCGQRASGAAVPDAEETQTPAPTPAPTATPYPETLPEGHTLAAIRARGELLVGTEADTWAVFKDEDGQICGMDAEWARAFGERLGVPVSFVLYDSVESTLTAVETGEVDIVAYFARTPERQERFSVSDDISIFGSGGNSVFIRSDDTSGLDLNTEEGISVATVAALKKTAQAERVAELYPKAKLLTFSTDKECFDALMNGTVNAWVPTSGNFTSTNEELLTAWYDGILVWSDFSIPGNGMGAGYIMMKGTEELTAAVNEFISICKEDGSYQAWYNKWESLKTELGY